MRITYRTLAKLISKMSDDQKDSDVTVEIPTESTSECYAAELRIAGQSHDGGLDDYHPVIYINIFNIDEEANLRIDDVNFISDYIGL